MSQILVDGWCTMGRNGSRLDETRIGRRKDLDYLHKGH